MTITLTEHMKKLLLNGTFSTTGNAYVHPLTTATTVPVASGPVSVSDDWQAFRNKVMRDMLDATAAQAVGKAAIPMTATAVLLDASLRKQLMNGAVFPGVIIASPEHPQPVELSAAWLKSNGCRCDMCVKLRHECGMGTPEVAPKDKRIDEMTHLDWKKCVDAFWPSRGRWE